MALDRLAILGVDIVVNARRARAQLHNLERQVRGTSTRINRLSMGIGVIGLGASGILLLRRAFGDIFEIIKDVTLVTAKFETQIINVEKIAKTGNINKLTIDFKALASEIRGISFEELSKTMATAARAGVKGDALINLTRAASMMAAVAGDIGGKEAAEGLARIIENMDLGDDSALRLASTIDALSDDFTTTSGEILKTTARLAGFANATNMSVQNLAAFSTALLSTGQTATVVRSTLTKLLEQLSADPLETANALKLTREEAEALIIAIRTGRPDEAIRLFTEGLNRLGKGNQRQALKDLGFASARVSAVIRILQGSLEKVEKAQDIANIEWNSGTSILKKFNLEASTTNSKLQDLENQLITFKTELSDNERVISLLSGQLMRLQVVIETLFGKNKFRIETDAIKSYDDAKNRLKALRVEADKLKNKLDSDSGIAKAQLLSPIPDISSLIKGRIARDTELATLVEIEKEFTRINKIAIALKQAEEEALGVEKLSVEEQKKKTEELEKQKALAIKAAFDPLTKEFGRTIAKLEADEFERKLLDLSIRLEETTEKFARIPDAAEKLEAAFGKLETDIIATRSKERKEAFRGSLKGLVGPFGAVVDIVEKFKDIKEKFDATGPTGKEGASFKFLIGELFKAELGDLTKAGRPKAEFIGLTEAWKKASIEIADKDPIATERLELAKKLLASSDASKSALFKAAAALEKIKELSGKDRVLK